MMKSLYVFCFLVLGTVGNAQMSAASGHGTKLSLQVSRGRSASRSASWTGGGLDVAVDGCGRMDASRLAGLLKMEVLDVLRKRRPGHPVLIHVVCRAGKMMLSVADPLTRKSLQRRVVGLDPDSPGKERILALSASELLTASWLELIRSRTGSTGVAAKDHAVESARKLAVAVVKRSVSMESPRRLSLAAMLQGAAVDLAHPFPVLGARLRVALEMGRGLQVTVTGSMYGGRARRDAGMVRLLMGGADLGVVWTWLRLGRFFMRTGLDLGIGQLSLTGLPASSDFAGRQFVHVVGMGTATLGGGVRIGPCRIGLDVTGSFVGPWVAGLVAGEPAVRPYGAWLGGALTAEWLL